MQDRRAHSGGIALRLGRWSAEHRWKAAGLWFGLLVILVAAGASSKKLTASGETSGDSAKCVRPSKRV